MSEPFRDVKRLSSQEKEEGSQADCYNNSYYPCNTLYHGLFINHKEILSPCPISQRETRLRCVSAEDSPMPAARNNYICLLVYIKNTLDISRVSVRTPQEPLFCASYM